LREIIGLQVRVGSVAALQLTIDQLSMKSRKKRASAIKARIVGTAHTVAGLRAAARLRRGQGVDVVEVRLDCLAAHARLLTGLLVAIRLPILLTARHPLEGGAGNLSSSSRRALIETFLPFASLIDVELRSAGAFADVLETARKKRLEILLSSHDFEQTPAATALARTQRGAQRRGADICKIAVQLRNSADLARLLLFQTGAKRPLATMGMGPLGKISRLLLPLAGSRLVYGYIDRPQVAGQWPAMLLAERLKEVAL
jgi:3-dehydroquinate dehydratase-1